MSNYCEQLSWDSDFFGWRIARLKPERLDQSIIDQALNWCREQQIKCLYFLADAADRETLRLAETHGFQLVDIRLTMERPLRNIDSFRAPELDEIFLRPWRTDDLETLKNIATAGHSDSRFYFDKNFPDSLCDNLYMTWIEKSCRGYADHVLIAEAEDRPIGYVSCHLRNNEEGQIGLIAVDVDWQRQGIGRRLVNESLNWFKKQGAKQAIAVTQGKNCQAQRLWQQSGFLSRSLKFWYHRWFLAKTK